MEISLLVLVHALLILSGGRYSEGNGVQSTSPTTASTAKVKSPKSGLLQLFTVDDFHYAIRASLGTPPQTLKLTVALDLVDSDINVVGQPLPNYQNRTYFNRSLSTSFQEFTGENETDIVPGDDCIKLENGANYAGVPLRVHTDDSALQLLVDQEYDGTLSTASMGYITNETMGQIHFTFSLDRTCVSEGISPAGALAYGNESIAVCKDPTPLGRNTDVVCNGYHMLGVSNVTVGSYFAQTLEGMSGFGVAVAFDKDDIVLPVALFEPIARAYNASREPDGSYTVDCDPPLPPITFVLDDSPPLSFDYEHVVYQKDGRCYLRVREARTSVDDFTCSEYYIGMPLFHQYCVSFNQAVSHSFHEINSFRIWQKKGGKRRMCQYISPATANATSIAIAEQSHKELLIGLCTAAALTLLLLLVAAFGAYRYRKKILQTRFLLAISERRRIQRTLVTVHEQNSYVPVDELDLASDDLVVLYAEKLGAGHFSMVYRGTLKARQAGNSVFPVAVKVALDVPSLQSENIWREIQRHKELGTQAHVVRMLGYKATDPYRPLIVLEYCSDGDLLKWLHRKGEESKSKADIFDFAAYCREQISIAWQISNGMDFISAKGIVHRDLAARNILLAEGLVAKVADFGLARGASDNVYPTKNFGHLPVKIMAPESLKSGMFTTKTDVWAFGLLLCELFSSGVEPFADISATDLLAALGEDVIPALPTNCPLDIAEIITHCCSTEAEARPSFGTLRRQLAGILEKSVANDGYLSFGTETTSNLAEHN